MGFFDKVKGFFGSGDAKTKIEIIRVEDPFPFQDPMHKGVALVTAEAGTITVKGYVAKFIAKVKNSEGNEEEVELGVDDSAASNWIGDDFPAKPATLQKGESLEVAFFIGDMDLVASLGKYGITNAETASIKGATFKIKIMIDIAETNFMFDPETERAVKVANNPEKV